MKSLVACPQTRPGRQRGGGEEVYVHVTQALAVDPMAINKRKHFIGLGDRCHWQIVQQLEHKCAVRKAAAGDFTHDERMGQYACVVEQIPKSSVAPAQVVHPDGGVDKDQGLDD